jgi:hypothetical protein
MNMRCARLAGVALCFVAGSVWAQPIEPQQRGPVLQLKPVQWLPKAVHRSQLRPVLKPESAEAESADVYVPPAQTNALAVQPVAAGAPVQLAATHANVSPAQPAAAANPLPVAVKDFVGTYLGAGVEVALAPSTTEPPRRMSQVDIKGDTNGFTVKWATMRVGANFKPETVKASEQEITFRPGATPGQYVAVGQDAAGAPVDATAELRDRTMIVVVATAGEKGGRSIQRYERTLTDRGMDVVFTRTDDGRLVRQVNLTLTRSGGSIWRGL